ncbi:unnamed protein product [Cladocopium goreaui]|uniref:Caroteno-chlorophyll a-c-binding protein n=1 Tax=Cladocopium goreaui TaxID=2562237 RepID=A0A9P1GTI4_9DINO|nr:unnamed protein product [Cladocopium goreaui]
MPKWLTAEYNDLLNKPVFTTMLIMRSKHQQVQAVPTPTAEAFEKDARAVLLVTRPKSARENHLEVHLDDVLFADDTTVFTTLGHFREDEEHLRQVMATWGEDLHADKTERLPLGISPAEAARISNTPEQSFQRQAKFLGAWITTDASQRIDTEKRLQRAKHIWYKLWPQLRRINIPATTKGRLFRSTVLASLCYSAEGRGFTQGEIRRMQAEQKAAAKAQSAAATADFRRNDQGLILCPHCNEPFAANRIWQHTHSCAVLPPERRILAKAERERRQRRLQAQRAPLAEQLNPRPPDPQPQANPRLNRAMRAGGLDGASAPLARVPAAPAQRRRLENGARVGMLEAGWRACVPAPLTESAQLSRELGAEMYVLPWKALARKPGLLRRFGDGAQPAALQALFVKELAIGQEIHQDHHTELVSVTCPHGGTERITQHLSFEEFMHKQPERENLTHKHLQQEPNTLKDWRKTRITKCQQQFSLLLATTLRPTAAVVFADAENPNDAQGLCYRHQNFMDPSLHVIHHHHHPSYFGSNTPRLHHHLTAMAALQQAMAVINQERAAKAQRTGKGKSKGPPHTAPAQPSQAAAAATPPDNTLVQNLARLTLQQQPMLRTAFDANSITFLLQPEETKTQLNDLVTTWLADLQGHKDTPGYQPFNCPKPVLILQFMCMQQAKPATADAASQPWAILSKCLATAPEELAPQLTDFRAKYRAPKENRKWVWQMTIASTAELFGQKSAQC